MSWRRRSRRCGRAVKLAEVERYAREAYEEVLQAAFDAVEQKYMQLWRNSAPDNAEGREVIHAQMRVVEDVRHAVTSMINADTQRQHGEALQKQYGDKLPNLGVV